MAIVTERIISFHPTDDPNGLRVTQSVGLDGDKVVLTGTTLHKRVADIMCDTQVGDDWITALGGAISQNKDNGPSGQFISPEITAEEVHDELTDKFRSSLGVTDGHRRTSVGELGVLMSQDTANVVDFDSSNDSFHDENPDWLSQQLDSERTDK